MTIDKSTLPDATPVVCEICLRSANPGEVFAPAYPGARNLVVCPDCVSWANSHPAGGIIMALLEPAISAEKEQA